MRLHDNVYLVGGGDLGFGISHPVDGHMYAVASDGEIALIDVGTGLDIAATERELRADGLDPGAIRQLIVTHYHGDHAGGLGRWMDRLGHGVRALAGANGADAIEADDDETTCLAAGRRSGLYPSDYFAGPAPIAVRLHGGDGIAVGRLRIVAVDTPGHCRGHVSFLLATPSKAFLFSGDAVFWGGTVALQNVPDCSVQESAASVERLAALEFDALLPGHLTIALSNGKRHVNVAAEHFRALRVPPPLVP